jgi:hypothetical protein
VAYEERLRVPWWGWLGGLTATAGLTAELTIGAPGLRVPALYAATLALAAAGLWALGRIRIAVTAEELLVDDARLPLRFVAAVQPLDAQARRELLGTGSHPLAFVVQRPWVRGAVRVDLDDPDDPTPYWLISTRRPAQLAAALTARAHQP